MVFKADVEAGSVPTGPTLVPVGNGLVPVGSKGPVPVPVPVGPTPVPVPMGSKPVPVPVGPTKKLEK